MSISSSTSIDELDFINNRLTRVGIGLRANDALSKLSTDQLADTKILTRSIHVETQPQPNRPLCRVGLDYLYGALQSLYCADSSMALDELPAWMVTRVWAVQVHCIILDLCYILGGNIFKDI